MTAGLGVLRLSPSAFWAMTPKELAAALNMVGGWAHGPLSRAALSALVARYPDHEVSRHGRAG